MRPTAARKTAPSRLRLAAVDKVTCTIDRLTFGVSNTVSCQVPAESPLPTDWWAAIGTVAATVLALIFGLVSLSFTLHERSLRRKQDAKLAAQAEAEHQGAKRNQAERVAAWLQSEMKPPSSSSSSSIRLLGPTKVWKIMVQNASDQPIWEVGITHWSLGDSKFAQIPVIAPGEKRELPCRPKPQSEGETLEEAVTVRFRDNSGRSWCRPGHVPGYLDLELDATFATPEISQAPEQYRAQSLKDLVEERWPHKKSKSKRK